MPTYVPAGFDRLSAAMPLTPVPTALTPLKTQRVKSYGTFSTAQPATLITGGLANCIAVVAINGLQSHAQIAHVDTGRLIDGSAKDQENLQRFLNLRNWLESETRANKWAIGLGEVWEHVRDNAGGSTGQALMAKLLNWLNLAFGVSPDSMKEVCGRCIKWSPEYGLQVGDEGTEWNASLWRDTGKNIPYPSSENPSGNPIRNLLSGWF